MTVQLIMGRRTPFQVPAKPAFPLSRKTLYGAARFIDRVSVKFIKIKGLA